MLAYFSGNVSIEARKDDHALPKVLGNALVHDHVPHGGGYQGGLFPSDFGVGFPVDWAEAPRAWMVNQGWFARRVIKHQLPTVLVGHRL